MDSTSLKFRSASGLVWAVEDDWLSDVTGMPSITYRGWLLALMDDEKYGNTWTEAASSFKQAVQQPQWENMARSVRKPLGKPAGRTLKSAKYTQSLPNAPAGEYVVLQYQTAFATVAATETVTMVLDTDKQWRTAGYFVK